MHLQATCQEDFRPLKLPKMLEEDLPVVIKNITVKILLANRNAPIADYFARSSAFNVIMFEFLSRVNVP